MTGLYKSSITFLINQTEEDKSDCTHFCNSFKLPQQQLNTKILSPPSSPPCSPVGTPPMSPVPTIEKDCCDSLLSLQSNQSITSPQIPSSTPSRKTHVPTKRPTPYSSTNCYVNWSLEKLRADTYYKALKVMEANPQENFQCTLFGSCDKKIKGKGNLRRHIEWHLKKIEEETRNKNNVLLPSDYHKMKEQEILAQKQQLELQKQRSQHRQLLQQHLQTQLQHLQTV